VAKPWPLQDAKNRFSELVDEAAQRGPQIVTRRGKEAAVVMSIDEYRRIVKPEGGLVEFFGASPLRGVELNLERSKEIAREVEL